MGEYQVQRVAIDSAGERQVVIEWRGDHGSAQVYNDADLKDPKFYSRYTLSDGVTNLALHDNGHTLQDPAGNLLQLQKLE
jgi:hypothetical protein